MNFSSKVGRIKVTVSQAIFFQLQFQELSLHLSATSTSEKLKENLTTPSTLKNKKQNKSSKTFDKKYLLSCNHLEEMRIKPSYMIIKLQLLGPHLTRLFNHLYWFQSFAYFYTSNISAIRNAIELFQNLLCNSLDNLAQKFKKYGAVKSNIVRKNFLKHRL